MRDVQILALVVLGSVLPACYCWQPAHQSEPKCIVARQVVDCTHEAINVLEPAALLLITDLIGAESPDWTAIEQRLEAFGFRDAGCLLAALENDFVKTQAIRPGGRERLLRIHDALLAFKRRHKAEDVRFRVMLADRTVVEL